MSSTPTNSETSKKTPVRPEKKLEQAQVMLVNSLKFIKDHCPETYHTIIKHCFDAGGVNERLQLVTKRKRVRVEDEDEEAEENEEEEDVASESDATTNISKKARVEVEQNTPSRVEEVNGGHEEFEELAASIKDILTGMKYQDDESITEIDFPSCSMTLKDLSDRCMSSVKYDSKYSVGVTTSLLLAYYIFFCKCEVMGDEETQKVLNTYTQKEKRQLYRVKNAGMFMCLVKEEFGAKFGIILGCSLGVNKIKKASLEKVSNMITMIKENQKHKIHEQIKGFTLPNKVQNLMEIAHYL